MIYGYELESIRAAGVSAGKVVLGSTEQAVSQH